MNNNYENEAELNDSELSEVNGGFTLGRKRRKDKKKKKTDCVADNVPSDGTDLLGTSVRIL